MTQPTVTEVDKAFDRAVRAIGDAPDVALACHVSPDGDALGSMLGLAFANWAARLLVAQLSTSTAPIALNLSLDWRVLAFTATTMVAAVVLFGTAPALRATRCGVPYKGPRAGLGKFLSRVC